MVAHIRQAGAKYAQYWPLICALNHGGLSSAGKRPLESGPGIRQDVRTERRSIDGSKLRDGYIAKCIYWPYLQVQSSGVSVDCRRVEGCLLSKARCGQRA